MTNIKNLFFELIRVAIGTQETLSRPPSKTEWTALYDMAKKQALLGICFAGLQKLYNSVNQEPRTKNPQSEPTHNPEPITQNLDEVQYLTWMGMAAKIQQRNEVVNRQCAELQAKLSADGMRSCVLKGQGIARLYSENLRLLRQSGDIDMLVDCDFVRAASFAKSSTDITVKWAYKDISLPIFQDTEVELHIKPGLMFNPFHNRTWQNWYNSNKDIIFLPESGIGFSTPSIEFNLIYILHHCYMHLFESGVGLRQVMDYYFVLRAANKEVPDGFSFDSAQEPKFQKVSNTLKSLGLVKFASAMMWVQKEVFGLEEKYMICEPKEKEGRFLLNEILQSGNFGKQDDRFERNISNRKDKLKYFFKRSGILVSHYPQESLWMPWYFVWHYIMKLIKK